MQDDTKRRAIMLDFSFDDDALIVQVLVEQVTIRCDVCRDDAYIFQDEGNFCLECWQERTEPCITIKERNQCTCRICRGEEDLPYLIK